MRGAIICDDDDEERTVVGIAPHPRGGKGDEIMNEKDGRSFPYRRTLTDT